jgi:hypothetical protein
VVDDGRIIELGSHEELVHRPGGRYADMFEAWIAHLESGADDHSDDTPEVVGTGTNG